MEQVVIFGHQTGYTGHTLQLYGLIGRGGQSVVASERSSEQSRELPLPAQKHPFPGNKDIIKNDHGMAAVERAGRGDEFHSRRTAGNSTGHRVVCSCFIMVTGREHYQLIGKNGIADMQFAADNSDSLFVFVHNADIKILMGLTRVFGVKAAAPLRVADRGADTRIVFLAPGAILFHVL